MIRSFIRTLGMLLIGCAGFFAAAKADEASEINRLFASGHPSEAFAQLDQQLAKRPRDSQLRFLKGVLLAESQRRDEAASVFEQLTVDYPDMPEPYNNLAVIYAAEAQYDKALASLEGAVRAQPAYAVAHQNLGDLYVQLARLSYMQAAKLDPGNSALAPKLAALRGVVKPLGAATAASAATSK